jgi:tetratricopeptide (TPR) repeat protein
MDADERRSLSELLKRDPRAVLARTAQSADPDARYMAGKASFRLQQLPQAQHFFRQAIAAGDRSANTHYYLGLIYERQGDHHSAEREYKWALSVNADHKQARQKLGMPLTDQPVAPGAREAKGHPTQPVAPRAGEAKGRSSRMWLPEDPEDFDNLEDRLYRLQKIDYRNEIRALPAFAKVLMFIVAIFIVSIAVWIVYGWFEPPTCVPTPDGCK